MEDAYDAIIFLKPLNQLHFSATTDFFFTPDFKKELKRRITILYGGRIKDMLNEYKVKTIEECIDLIAKPEPIRANTLQAN